MFVLPKTSENVISNYGIGVESECGKLDVVIMHRPGQELLRLKEDNLQNLLYDGIPNIDEAHKSHDVFTQYLREHGSQVLYVKELLRETLEFSNEARYTFINGIVANCSIKVDSQEEFLTALRQWLLTRNLDQLAEDAITGVAYSLDELGDSPIAQNLLSLKTEPYEFIIPPLPNLLFARDLFSLIEKNVFIWQMAKPARRNEPLIVRVIFQHHPQLSTCGLNLVEWQKLVTDNQHATIEGGDVAYLGQGVLLIGFSERTNQSGIEALARTGVFRRVIAVKIPPQRDYMHLDTILSSVGKHAFTLHGPLANILEAFTVETHDADGNSYSEPKWVSHGCDIRTALRKLLDNNELVFYDAANDETSVEEQRRCRHNVFVLDDGHIVTYNGGDLEKGITAHLTRDNAVQVGLIPTKGLLEGGGGVHCMTNALRRRSI